GASRVLAPRSRAPQYLPECTAAPAADLTNPVRADAAVCRANHGCRGLYRIGSNRAVSGSQCCGVARWQAAPGAATDDGAPRLSTLYLGSEPGHIPTNEYSLWSTATSGNAHTPEKSAACRHDRPVPGGPAGVAQLGARLMKTYIAAFQRYLDIERQASPH